MNEYLTFAENIQTKITGSVLTDAPMSDYTTWKIGGKADVFAVPQTIADLAVILAMADEAGIPLMIIGKGSNLLVSDNGIRGLVVQIAEKLNNIEWLAGSKVLVQAGVTMTGLAWECAKRNLSGLEWAVGIPGNLGGALIMNAGAYGSNISSYVTKIEVMEYNGKRKWLNRDELQFGYRHGFSTGTSVIISVELQLSAGDRTVSEANMREILQTRTKNQPLEYPSAGSVFKNPESDHAGRLIEAAGCKGMRVGDAQVSLKHGNFIVNLGNAKATDVLALIANVQKRVWQEFAVQLETEVRLIG